MFIKWVDPNLTEGEIISNLPSYLKLFGREKVGAALDPPL